MGYMYDPAVGEAVEVTNGGQQPAINPEAPAAEEVAAFRRDQTAQALANREQHTSTMGDTESSDALGLEVQLQQVQQQLYRGGLNPLEEQQLIQQAESIAAQLSGAPKPRTEETEPDNWDQSYKNSNPGVEEDLAFAGEVMGEELATEFNTLISDDNELTRVAALDTIKHLRQSPEAFMSREESTGIDESTQAEIASQFGEKMAADIATLGNAVAKGVCSPTDAIKLAAKNPEFQQALYTLAQQGTIRIAL